MAENESSESTSSNGQGPNLEPRDPDLMKRLPAELRNEIYELVLPTNEHFELDYKYTGPALLWVAKYIREEASKMFYANNAFRLSGYAYPPKAAMTLRNLRNIITDCGATPFSQIKIDVWSNAYVYLAKLLPLLELMRETRFEPATEEYTGRKLVRYSSRGGDRAEAQTSSDSVFAMRSTTYVAAQEALERALTLGRKARDEQWTQQELETQFRALVKRKGRAAPKLARRRHKGV